jgi:3-methyl-2-oxobutanoate hydroxymethyltransferase
VLVGADMLGLNTGFRPRFLKQFGDLRERAQTAVRQYMSEVQVGQFPGAEHSHR